MGRRDKGIELKSGEVDLAEFLFRTLIETDCPPVGG